MSPELKSLFTKCSFIVSWLIHCKKAEDYYKKEYEIEEIKRKQL